MVMQAMVRIGGDVMPSMVMACGGGGGVIRPLVTAGGVAVRQTGMAGARGITVTTRSMSSTFSLPYTVPTGPWGENRSARLELAAAYRGLDQMNLNEGICNHLSVMTPRADGKEGSVMLVVNYGLHWSEVTASGLLGVDGEAELVEGEGEPDIAASCIHLGIRKVRPDARVVMHTHQPYVTALACLKDPTLLMVHQNSTRFYQRVAYDNCYSGLALAMDEGNRLGKALGAIMLQELVDSNSNLERTDLNLHQMSNQMQLVLGGTGDKDVLFMGHHGVVVVAQSVALAFDNLYYLERAAQVQILAQSTQKEVELLPEEECQKASQDIWRDIKKYSDAQFYSMYRRLRQTQPDFEL